MQQGRLELLDFILIALYFLLVFGLAAWVTRREKRRKAEGYGTQDYFLGGRNLGWFVIGASLFASNIGSEHLVGLAGSGARGDMPAAQFELLASFMLILLGWLFVPFYLRSGVYTMPEFLERRYSRSARNYLSILSILAYILTKISVTIFAGALVFEVLGVPFWTGALLVVVATGLYTILGGLRVVLYTDMLQMIVLLTGSIGLTIYGFAALGGWAGFTQTMASAGASPGRFLNLWRPLSDPDFPWTGILFGAPILGVWYWCTDQFIVQRVLSARDVSHARRGALFGGFLKILPLFLFVLPGVLAFALAERELITLNGEPDTALPALITGFLPAGLRGLLLAGLLAALMSSLSSVFNSCSTLFTIDFYKRWRPGSSERELVVVGQAATAVLVAIGLLWIPLMRTLMEEGGFYKYLQSIQAYISPPIAAVFLLGLFVKRINARGAMAALWTGFALGIGRLLLEYAKESDRLAAGSLAYTLAEINFLYIAMLLFALCAVVMLLVSLTAPPRPGHLLRDVTFSRPDSKANRFHPSNPDFWWTVLLAAAIVGVWLLFSPLVLGR